MSNHHPAVEDLEKRRTLARQFGVLAASIHGYDFRLVGIEIESRFVIAVGVLEEILRLEGAALMRLSVCCREQGDPSIRERVLNNVPAHRGIVAAWKAQSERSAGA